MSTMGTFGQVLKGSDTVVQGIGTIGIYKCIIVGSIACCIGLILWYNAHYMDIPHKVIITKIQDPNRDDNALCSSGGSDNTKYKCTKYTQLIHVDFEGNEIPIRTDPSTTIPTYRVGQEIYIVAALGGGYKINDGSRTILLWTGRIIAFIAIASALFCYKMRDNPWFRRIMGVKTGVDTARYVFGK